MAEELTPPVMQSK